MKIRFKSDNFGAFTLVELIVVIVILAILATIAFLSFSSQSSSARDSTRLSDLSNITKGLGVFNAVSSKLPIPDSYISITASGTNISYQGYAGMTVLNMIKLSNGGKDPLDKTYYTYSTNVNQNKYQILGFLEDGSNNALSINPFFRIQASADSDSYSGRYMVTKGEILGILLSSGTLIPIQTPGILNGSGLDIVNTTDSYVIQYFNKDSVAGTGLTLFSNIYSRRADISGDTNLAKLDESIIGFWDMETLNGGKLKDFSKYGNDGTLSGGIQIGGVEGNIKIGKSTFFDGIDDSIIIPNSTSLNLGTTDYTISFYSMSPFSTPPNGYWPLIIGKGGSSSALANTWGWLIAANYNNRIFFQHSSDAGGAFDVSASINNIPDGWHHFVSTRENGEVKIYFDGKLKNTFTGAIQNLTNSYPLIFGKPEGSVYPLIKGLDQIRIYKRSLSEPEISSLYGLSR